MQVAAPTLPAQSSYARHAVRLHRGRMLALTLASIVLFTPDTADGSDESKLVEIVEPKPPSPLPRVKWSSTKRMF